MKKIYSFFIGVMVVLLASCSGVSKEAVKSSSPVLLTKTIETFSDGSTLTTNFTYNGNKLVGWTDSEGEKETFSYDSSGRLISSQLQEYNDEDVLETIPVTFSYDSQGRLASFEFDKSTKIELVYKADDVILVNYYNLNALSESFLWKYSNGNKVSETGQSISEGQNWGSQYDDHNNPFVNIYMFTEAFKYYLDLNNNNLVKRIFNGEANSPDSSSMSYTYNSLGYPLTDSLVFEGETSTIQYFYNQ